MRKVDKRKFYDYIYRQPYYNAMQIGFSAIRYTNSIGKLLGIITFHKDGNTYMIK